MALLLTWPTSSLKLPIREILDMVNRIQTIPRALTSSSDVTVVLQNRSVLICNKSNIMTTEVSLVELFLESHFDSYLLHLWLHLACNKFND